MNATNPTRDLSPIDQVNMHIRAGKPLIWITTQEERRTMNHVMALLTTSERHKSRPIYHWAVSTGLGPIAVDETTRAYRIDPDGESDRIDCEDTLIKIATDGESAQEPRGQEGFYILKDPHPYMDDPATARALKDCLVGLPGKRRTLIVIAPALGNMPEEIKRMIAVVDWPLPTAAELRALLDSYILRLREKKSHIPIHLDESEQDRMARALLGLAAWQAESVLNLAIVAFERLDIGALGFVIDQKAQTIKASGLAEFMPVGSLPPLGGMPNLKTYQARKAKSFTKRAADFGIAPPRGTVLVGPQGVGKSHGAKTFGQNWELPILRLDVGRLFGRHVGESEENTRAALALAEAVAPCVLWLDEIDKVLAQSGGETDGGTSTRVFGTLLVWLAEHTSPVYVVATANWIKHLPPELFRKGRFDSVFFVDLPTAQERREIWSIHIARKNRAAGDFDLDALVEASKNNTGAEIEIAVNEALENAFFEDSELTTEHMIAAILGMSKLADNSPETIQVLRTWAKEIGSSDATATETVTDDDAGLVFADLGQSLADV